ncbi:MAG: helix-turn-helix domain-containing protein [Actinomycetota bacterium]|nr:helix-turn-helix domain-containing protein [Actinomycetota bacterium]
MTAAQAGRDPSVSSPLAQTGGGPTVLRIMVGTQLRRLREAAGITREAAGEVIRASHAKISRLELGRVGYKERDVADLLTLYGVTDEQDRGAMLALARQANTPGWWHRYGDVLPSWFEMYVGLEQAASVIRTYEVQFVPGLLQTEEYTRAVAGLSHLGESAEEIEDRVRLRKARQTFLTQPQAPNLWAIVDEAALWRPFGGRQVMRTQLQRLIELTELPNITLQIVSFRRGGHAAAGGPFTVLRFCEPDLPDIIYLEQLTSALYLDKRRDTDHYLAVFNRLGVEAEPPAETVRFLNSILNEA